MKQIIAIVLMLSILLVVGCSLEQPGSVVSSDDSENMDEGLQEEPVVVNVPTANSEQVQEGSVE